jgi:hypothetical protein
MIETYQVRRSAWRMWLLAMSGIPLVVIGVDVLGQRRLSNWLSDLIFQSDPQAYEPRDIVWAVALVLVGLVLSIIGLKELVVPKVVLAADADGLQLRLAGPRQPPVAIPWESLEDVRADVMNDDGDLVPVLVVSVKEDGLLPADPWAARRTATNTVAINATDWEQRPETVAEKVTEVAIEVARAWRRA